MASSFVDAHLATLDNDKKKTWELPEAGSWKLEAEDNGMTWLTALIAVALLAAVAAITGLKPRGTRRVAGTQMMMAARIVLVLAILYFVWHGA